MTQVELFTHILFFERGTLIMFCLFWAYYLFIYRGDHPWRNNWQMRYLGGGLMLWKALVYLFSLVLELPQAADSEHLKLLSYQFDMVTVAWVVLLLTGLSRRRRLTRWLPMAHFLPLVVLMALNFCLPVQLIWRISYAYISLYAFVFLFLCGRSVLRYNDYIHSEYALFSRRQLTRCVWVMMFMVLQFAIWSTMFWLPYQICDLIYYLTSLVLWALTNFNIDYILAEREASHVDVNLFPLSLDELEQHRSRQVTEEPLTPTVVETTDQPTETTDQQKDEMFLYRLRTICEEPKLYTQEGITRDDLARAMHINHTYFTAMLRRTTGKTFYEYIHDLRMTYALQLLSDPSFPLDQIPLEVGYRHKSTYYRVFQDRFGCKPAQWREKHLTSHS